MLSWKTGVVGLALALALVVPRPLAAHHGSPLFFDHSRTITVTGTIVRAEWVNPHILLFVEGKNAKGEPETWIVEGTSLNNALRREGMRERLQPGLSVVVLAHPQRQALALTDPLTVWPATPGDPRHSPRIVEGGQVRLPNGEVHAWGGGPKF